MHGGAEGERSSAMALVCKPRGFVNRRRGRGPHCWRSPRRTDTASALIRSPELRQGGGGGGVGGQGGCRRRRAAAAVPEAALQPARGCPGTAALLVGASRGQGVSCRCLTKAPTACSTLATAGCPAQGANRPAAANRMHARSPAVARVPSASCRLSRWRVCVGAAYNHHEDHYLIGGLSHCCGFCGSCCAEPQAAEASGGAAAEQPPIVRNAGYFEFSRLRNVLTQWPAASSSPGRTATGCTPASPGRCAALRRPRSRRRPCICASACIGGRGPSAGPRNAPGSIYITSSTRFTGLNTLPP